MSCGVEYNVVWKINDVLALTLKDEKSLFGGSGANYVFGVALVHPFIAIRDISNP